VPKKKPLTDGDIDMALEDARDAGSPDPVIERLLAAVEDPALRGDDFDPAYALVMVSELHQTYGRMDEAIETLRAAVRDGVRGEYSDPKASLASLLVDAGRKAEAAAVFKELRKENPGPLAYEIYGEALETAGDLDEAVKVFAAGELLAERTGQSFYAEALDRAVTRVRRDMGFPEG
jgi:predicted Zn-dependent protease